MTIKVTGVSDHTLTTLSSVRTSPKWSLKGRQPIILGSASRAPGPGAYQPSVDGKFSNSAKYGFGSSKRDGLARSNTAPGPGRYNPNDPNKTTTRWAFGKGQRGKLSAGSDGKPGPGTYSIPSKLHEGPAYSISPRHQELVEAKRVAPGPGTYQPPVQVKWSAPKWGFGTSSRTSLSGTSRAPGPGTYGVKPTVGEGPKWSLRSRHDISLEKRGSTASGVGATYSQFGY